MNRIDLAGRVAVVTGGAQGIGLAIAERLLDSGAGVALWDIDDGSLGKAASRLGGRGKVSSTSGRAHRRSLGQGAPPTPRWPRTAASTSSSTTPASPAATRRPGSSRPTSGAASSTSTSSAPT